MKNKIFFIMALFWAFTNSLTASDDYSLEPWNHDAREKVTNYRPLEQCDMLQGGWGYNKDCKVIRDAANVVSLIARAASKGSNLLLNVAPNGEWEIPADAEKVLIEVGEWLAKNGESIYDTRGCDAGDGRN